MSEGSPKKLFTYNVSKAIHDLRFLLNRGYRKKEAIEFVGNHYLLDKNQREILFRIIFSKNEKEKVSKKLVNKEYINGKTIIFDGFNVLITTEAIMRGNYVILCDDGIIRDFERIFYKYKVKEETFRALKVICSLLLELNPKKVIFLFDKQISKSGKLVSKLNKMLKNMDIKGEALTEKSVDYEILRRIKGKNQDVIVCSSDSRIVRDAKFIFDFPNYIINSLKYNRVIYTRELETIF
ncbi:MAG: DUF434 domain-containing protein [Candidatus Asgardarchaeia archaeon]